MTGSNRASGYKSDLPSTLEAHENISIRYDSLRGSVCRRFSFLWGIHMRSKLLLCVVLCLGTAAYAKEPKAYQNGKIVQMVSVQCGTAEKDSASLAGEMLGTDSGTRKTQQLLCKEYVLETEQVVYHIRPKNEKHNVLIPIGEQAQFRLQKDNMMLRVEGLDKEREYIVVSMTPRMDANTADASPARANHLQ